MNRGLLIATLSASLLCAHEVSAQQTDPSEPAPMVDPKLEPPPGSNIEPFDVAPPKDPPTRVPVPGIVLIGIGSVGIAIGIAGAALSGHQGTIATNDAKEIKKGHGLCQPIVGNYASLCNDVAKATKAHNTWQKVARGGLAVGIAAAAAGVIYLYGPMADRRPNAASSRLRYGRASIPSLRPMHWASSGRGPSNEARYQEPHWVIGIGNCGIRHGAHELRRYGSMLARVMRACLSGSRDGRYQLCERRWSGR